MVRGARGSLDYDGAHHYFHPLGDFSSLGERDRYDAAKKAADTHIDLGGSTKAHTVKEACESHLEKLKTERGEQAEKDSEGYSAAWSMLIL